MARFSQCMMLSSVTTEAGSYLNDQTLINRARQRWLDLVQSEVAQDGSLPLEICRSDTSNWCDGPTKGIRGLAYTHYALYPTTIAAEILRNLGQDVYSTPQGALLCKAYGKAAAWTLHPETFPFSSQTTESFRTLTISTILYSSAPLPYIRRSSDPG